MAMLTGTTLHKIPSLLIYYHGSFITHENGAHARVIECLNFARQFANKVTVYSYNNHPDWPWTPAAQDRFHKEFPDVTLVLDRRTPAMIAFSKLKVFLISFFPSLAPILIRAGLPGAAPNYRQLFCNEITLVNYASGVLELNGLRSSNWMIDTHDVQFLNYAKRYKKRVSDIKVTLKARSEIEIVSQSSATLAISLLEANLFRMLAPDTPIFFVASFQDIDAAVRDGTRNFVYDLLFVGSQNPFNIDGICEFIGTHRHWLKNRRLAIAGRVCFEPRVVEATRGMENVALLGYVEDLSCIFAESKAAISPVGGTGLKIKLLDAFRAGKPVFATADSMAALPKGYWDCAFPITEDYMNAVLDNDIFREKAEAASLHYSERLGEYSDFAAFKDFLISSSLNAQEHALAEKFGSHISRVRG